MAAFSVQDAQSQRFLPVENSPTPLCSISMGGKSGGYAYYIGELPQSKPDGFASSLGEGASGAPGHLLIVPNTLAMDFTAWLPLRGKTSPAPGEDVTVGDKRGNLARERLRGPAPPGGAVA